MVTSFIFLIGIIVEIAFVVFCIIKKSNNIRGRSIIRIAYFILFILLTILKIIYWSLRYYALAFLLLILALVGAKALIQNTKHEYKPAHVILKTIGVISLIFVFILPAIIFPQNKAVVVTTGLHKVLTQTYTYIDKNRVESYINTVENRKLNVQFWYPDKSNQTYPLIVFSHGGLGIKSSNESLYNELTSHGYIVCSIDHSYQSFYTTDENGDTIWIDLEYMKELLAEDPQSDIQKSYGLYQKWMKIRTDDINFTIDYIISEVESIDADIVYKLLDIAKIGVMGHSLGGSAALGIGRIRTDVNAVIALESPFICDIEGVEDEQFVFTDKIYPVALLNVYSDSSWNILGKRPQYAANYKMLFDTQVNTFNVYISGVGHLALTDFALTSPFLTRILDGKKPTTKALDCLKTINMICLEFFNSYLKGYGEFTSDGFY